MGLAINKFNVIISSEQAKIEANTLFVPSTTHTHTHLEQHLGQTYRETADTSLSLHWNVGEEIRDALAIVGTPYGFGQDHTYINALERGREKQIQSHWNKLKA